MSVFSDLILFVLLFFCCRAAALNVVFLRLGFVGTLPVRSCSYEKWLCRGGGEPASMFSFVGSSCLIFLFLIFMLVLFCFFCCLFVVLPVVSYHLQGRVHDSDSLQL